MLVLGIESSCDDTSVALVDSSDRGHFVINESSASQIDLHAAFGGVVPELAGRAHAEKIVPLIEAVITPSSAREGGGPLARQSFSGGAGSGSIRPDVIAVTAGPGLVTGLLVGVEAARTLAWAWNIPLVAVNHIDGHIHSVELKTQSASRRTKLKTNNSNTYNLTPKTSIKFPALCLVVSGGHTELILMRNHGEYEYLGRTLDDAAGECFDKVAKLLGLTYPGGPQISKLAAGGKTNAIPFPRPMLKENNYNFSFAGLKTAVLYWLRDHTLAAAETIPPSLPAGIFGQTPTEPTINDFCASFEQAIIDVLVGKTLRAAAAYKPNTIILAGGVSANKKLRETLEVTIGQTFPNSEFRIPDSQYCMDNGAMIAVAGYYKAKQGKTTDWKTISVDPNWKITDTLL